MPGPCDTVRGPGAFPDTEHLAGAAAGHADLPDDDTFAWTTGAVLQKQKLLRKVRLPVPPAMTLPDRAAHVLLDILHPEPEEDGIPGTPGPGAAH